MKTKSAKKDIVNVITLGCSKNIVDSENLITQLEAGDLEVRHDSDNEDANVVIINTCGFIDLAKEESINTILNYAAVKSEGGIDKLYVTGCLSERYREDLKTEIPEVDAYFGTMELPLLLEKFDIDYKHELIGERSTTTPFHYAYMKISEGCNRTCSFCAIPLMRGKHISKPIEDLVTEARNLAKKGVKEIILIAQELTYYGLDLYKERSLGKLLDALCEVDGIEWIRLHYAYPSKFPTEIFEVMARQQKICNYLDIPLQHAADNVLKAMKRQTTRAYQKELIEMARKTVPGIAIRTTFLVGFPGETEDDFEDLCDFAREMKFDRMGVFRYSHEEDTGAYELEDDVAEDIKIERSNSLMEIQQEISHEQNLAKIDQIYRVLIDRKEGEFYVGRTEHDSPEVDNEVLIPAEDHYLSIGNFVKVKIYDADFYDVYGEIVE
jgi:ribosomal protein S12 methylthiotransferase